MVGSHFLFCNKKTRQLTDSLSQSLHLISDACTNVLLFARHRHWIVKIFLSVIQTKVENTLWNDWSEFNEIFRDFDLEFSLYFISYELSKIWLYFKLFFNIQTMRLGRLWNCTLCPLWISLLLIYLHPGFARRILILNECSYSTDPINTIRRTRNIDIIC